MAKKQLTIEEKLQAALVPVEEQPYKVPENWCWVKLGTVITASKEKQDAFDSETKYVGLEHIEKDTGNISFALADEVKSTKSVFKCGDILYGKLRPYLNKHGIVDFNGVCSTDILVFNAIKGDNRLYDFYFSLPHFIEYAVSNSKGINLPRVSEKVILEIPFPIPPQGEQSRIVARIESLFAKLDEAKEKIQEVLDGADLRRAAILHQAFTGKLTEKWRREHGVRLEDWRKTTLKKISSAIGDGLHGTPEYDAEGKYFFINGNNFFDDHIEIKPDTKKVNEKEYNKYKIALSSRNTVFLSINGTLGKTAFYNNEPVILGKSACYINVMSMVNKYWLKNFFQTLEFINYANEKATGSTIKNLGLKAIREKKIYLPSMSEQQEIVCLLDNLLSREQSTVTACEEALTTIDTLKKSILARAFRGELGTNDPAEPNAKELLKEILSA